MPTNPGTGNDIGTFTIYIFNNAFMLLNVTCDIIMIIKASSLLRRVVIVRVQ